MSRLLRSARLRRRMRLLAVLAALIGGVVALSFAYASLTAPNKQVFTNQPAQRSAEPATEHSSPARTQEALSIASQFVRTAVVRHDVDASWPLIAPSFRVGYTRREWATGNNSVIPYPARGLMFGGIEWSFHNELALDLVLLPKRHSAVDAKTFTLILDRSPRIEHDRWLVASWYPNGLSMSTIHPASLSGPISPPKGLSRAWLLAPVAIFAVLLLLPVFLGTRGYLRKARAERIYRSTAT